MQLERVVAVEGEGSSGSGYLIASRLVLTSAHVVARSGAGAEVSSPVDSAAAGESAHHHGTVVWCGTPGGPDDAALVEIDDPDWEGPAGGVRWGRLVTNRPVADCAAWGFPDVAQGDAGPAESWQPVGTVNPGDMRVGNRYVLTVTGAPPGSPGPGASPWAGHSGAALFHGDLLIGVVQLDAKGWNHSRLVAVPVHLLHGHRDPGFRRVLAAHGALAPVEAAEWQHLTEHADQYGTTPELPSPSWLLRPEQEVVAFHGRDGLLDELETWCAAPGFGAWLLHAPGGQGKTRLARELATRRAATGQSVLWLRDSVGPQDLAALADAVTPTLLVLDYAEHRVGQLTALCDAAARRRSREGFKLLLLTRSAGDWWQQAARASATTGRLLELARVTSLPPLDPDPSDWTSAYRRAVTAFGAALPLVHGRANLTAGPDGDRDWQRKTAALCEAAPERTARAPGLANALTLQMTALADLLDAAGPAVAPHGTVGGGLPDDDFPDGVEDRLLEHEARYWASSAVAHRLPVSSPNTLSEALAAAFLLGAADPAQADEVLGRTRGLGDQSHDCRDAVRLWIARLYPPNGDGQWGTMLPDRLTERFIGRRLHDRLTAGAPSFDGLVTGATPAQAHRLVALCTRAVAHPTAPDSIRREVARLCAAHPDRLGPATVATVTWAEAPEPLLAALTMLVDDPDLTLEDLVRLTGALPYSSTRLAPVALRLTERLVARRRELVREDRPTHVAALSLDLIRLTDWSAATGHHGEALAAVEEAVGLQREVAADGAHRQSLAVYLAGLAGRLRVVGRSREALAASDEAVAVFRSLPHVESDDHLFVLGNVLSSQALSLHAEGRRAEAAATAEEATAVFRELADRDPDRFLHNLASALAVNATYLTETGRHADALAASETSVAALRTLAERNPDARLPAFATALAGLAQHQRNAGLWDEALASVEQAVRIARDLLGSSRDTHLAMLVACLNDRAVHQSAVGRRAEGLASISEAVGLCRELVDRDRTAHLPSLAGALINLALYQGGARVDEEEALRNAREAVEISRELVDRHRAAHLPSLAFSLNVLAGVEGWSRQYAKAAATATESVAAFDELALLVPTGYRPNRALALTNLAVQQAAAGQRANATTTADRAVRAYLDAQLPDLALDVAGARPVEPLATIEEAVTTYLDTPAHPRGIYQGAFELSHRVKAWLAAAR
ncbi:hypothetical protein ACFY00_22155 [Kitasatospora sp. NPDC001540]|uniref:hypothetical protein n=1 Tax=Kitasatospora sp. NPDC001540 TaxID=3364014 RepID=UPI0036A483C6